MKVKIEYTTAEDILKNAIKQAKLKYELQSDFSDEIKKIILGSHKTYRYIFVNALLAKATNEKVNPLSLQKGSSLEGAFDARSLCHKVLVKVERTMMESSLGGSNEPFLNKPARYKELSLKNAVRRGTDSELLRLCIDVLSSIKKSPEAFKALTDALFYSFLRNPTREIDIDGKSICLEVLQIKNLMIKLLSRSCGGESAVLVSAIAFELVGLSKEIELDVKPHIVNQPGDSSKEFSDIDIFYNGSLIYTAEVKDKKHTMHDIY